MSKRIEMELDLDAKTCEAPFFLGLLDEDSAESGDDKPRKPKPPPPPPPEDTRKYPCDCPGY